MNKKDINNKPFDEGTLLKLDIFRDCFREWFPVFVHNPAISHIFIYDMFAGSGKDSIGMDGSPLILLNEARGTEKQHCRALSNSQSKSVYFGFNEFDFNKRTALETLLRNNQSLCQKNCLQECPYTNSLFFQSEDFKKLFLNVNFRRVLANPKFAKFVLLDQYGFKQIDEDVFVELVNSPTTDFIFFIASSFIRRFQTLPAVTKYFRENQIRFDEAKPKECHRAIADYYKSLVPSDKEYYINAFTIQKGKNYYGLIFGTNHSLGMEKFVKVCWKHDSMSGDSNCNIDEDYLPGTLFFDQENSNKKSMVKEQIERLILNGSITTNIEGLKYALTHGCEPKLFVEVITKLKKDQRISIEGKFNRQSSNIHKVDKYNIVLL